MSRPLILRGVAKAGLIAFGLAFVVAVLLSGSGGGEPPRLVSAADHAEGGSTERAPAPAYELRTVPVPTDAVLDALRQRRPAAPARVSAPAAVATATPTATATPLTTATPTPIPAPVQEPAPVATARPVPPPAAPEEGSFDRSGGGSGEFDLPGDGP